MRWRRVIALILTLIFGILRVAGVLKWSWLWVFSPIYLVIMCEYAFVAIVMIIASLLENK